MQYNKYKKITQPGKCSKCGNKNIFKSYRNACDSCIVQY